MRAVRPDVGVVSTIHVLYKAIEETRFLAVFMYIALVCLYRSIHICVCIQKHAEIVSIALRLPQAAGYLSLLS